MFAVPEKEHFTVEIFNTGKVIQVHLGGPGNEPDEESYRALRHELRCQRSGAESPIDPRLIEILHQIALSTGQRIQVVSAFRGLGRSGDFNYHTKGMAADIKVPGVTTEDLRDLAKSLGATGVGYYPTVQFVHVDVRGTPYFWTDSSGHGEHSHSTEGFAAADTTENAEPAAAGGCPSRRAARPSRGGFRRGGRDSPPAGRRHLGQRHAGGAARRTDAGPHGRACVGSRFAARQSLAGRGRTGGHAGQALESHAQPEAEDPRRLVGRDLPVVRVHFARLKVLLRAIRGLHAGQVAPAFLRLSRVPLVDGITATIV